jgi:hypothetical protein
MQVVHARCCGLDVHKKTVVACVLFTYERGRVTREVRTFGTMTADLLALSDWLSGCEVTHVAMESMGGTRPPQWCKSWGAPSKEFLLAVNSQPAPAGC